MKRAYKAQLAAAATQVAANIHVWAVNKQNIELAEKMDYTDKELGRQRDNVLPVTASNILKTAQAHLDETDLSDYGITKETIQELSDLLDLYDGKNSSTRVARSEQKTATVNVAHHIEAGNRYLELLDKLIGNFAKDNPDFVSDYGSARMVIDLGTRYEKKGPAKSQSSS